MYIGFLLCNRKSIIENDLSDLTYLNNFLIVFLILDWFNKGTNIAVIRFYLAYFLDRPLNLVINISPIFRGSIEQKFSTLLYFI